MTKTPLFDLGLVTATAAVLRMADEHHVDIFSLVARHAAGDWGALDPEDWAANNAAVHNGGWLLSRYNTAGGAVYVTTEWDRSLTTIMLREER